VSGPKTISPGYLEQQIGLHQDPEYGVASIAFAPLVKDLLGAFKARSISDYGAGKQNLKKALTNLGVSGFEYFPYDPAFPEYGAPRPADLVCCIDVLEHIEPEFVGVVIEELRSITTKVGMFSIATIAAKKTLSDGRNAHLIQQPSSWWLPKLCMHFEVGRLQRTQEGFWVLVEPRKG
jgi:hypothetical protein